MADIPYDRKEQLRQIESGLLPGEQIIAVYDAIGTGTGFLGLTDRRVIVQDKSFAGKRIAITSIPYSKISAVSVVSNKSFAGGFFSSGAIAIHVGTHTYEVDFRGDNKAHHVHNVILHHISRT
ncbi:PH domain-containing protein [Nonomuraea sp. NPDC049141]|uniref:PH domain-containing protein n=1 Tax=unclassified Nonomuraea TaxID=2593643 RepID=UPI0033C41BB5